MALLNRSSSETRAMRAVARQREKYTHDVKAAIHAITVDEPNDSGGDDLGPSPQELLAAALASCTAVTMEMYAAAQGLGRQRPRGRLPLHARRARLPDHASSWSSRCPRTSTRSRSSGCR